MSNFRYDNTNTNDKMNTQTTTTTRKPRNGEYEIYQEVGGEHVRTMLTGSRPKAVAEVERLLALGVSQYDIYATYCGKNFGQASTHLLLPSQRA